LFYGVKLIKAGGRSASFISDIVNDISPRVSNRESTIIYCTTVRDTEQVPAPEHLHFEIEIANFAHHLFFYLTVFPYVSAQFLFFVTHTSKLLFCTFCFVCYPPLGIWFVTPQVHEDLGSNGITSCIYHGQMESSDRELSHK
jgi:hypothetical protein